MAGRLPLDELFSKLLGDFNAAIEKKDGWAWNDIKVGTKMHDVSTRLRHWKRSVEGFGSEISALKTGRGSNSTDTGNAFRDFLQSLETDSYHSGVIRSNLEDIRSTLDSIHDFQAGEAGDEDPALESAMVDELEESVQALGLQLEPLSVFAQDRKLEIENSQKSAPNNSVPMLTPSSTWIWHEEYQNYYMVGWDANGQPTYIWAKQVHENHTSKTLPRQDSISSPMYQERIHGTSGLREILDASYFVREGSERERFFKTGRVFTILWSETAGASADSGVGGVNDTFTVVRFGENVYSQIRRFVVVSAPARRGFVYACGISTYSGRGVLKPGCIASDHAVVHFSGSNPYWVEDEVNAGMPSEAIEVEPSEANASIHWASRINFGKTVSIEKNVKVKDVGFVKPEHRARLIMYWKMATSEENDSWS